MIRWYDWIVALFIADFILTSIITGFIATIWWQQCFAISLAYLLYELWIYYCDFRKKAEQKG